MSLNYTHQAARLLVLADQHFAELEPLELLSVLVVACGMRTGAFLYPASPETALLGHAAVMSAAARLAQNIEKVKANVGGNA